MRIFGSDRISGLMQRLGMEEGVPIEHGMVTKAIERAQKQVEAQNFAVRKHLLEYDDVMNKQRERIYTLRREILEGKIHLPEGEEVDVRGYLLATAEDLFDDRIEQFVGKDVDEDDWDIPALGRELQQVFGLDDDDLTGIDSMGAEELGDALWAKVRAKYEEKEKIVPRDILTRVERDIMLQIVDQQWKDHLYSLDHLKEGIGLRGYGQRDPLVEYKKESFALFQDMLKRVEEEMVRYVWWLKPVVERDGGEPKSGGAGASRASPAGGAQLQQSVGTGHAGAVRRTRGRTRGAGRGQRPRAGSPARAGRRRRRHQDGEARRTQDRPQRSVLVRQRQEIQEMPRSLTGTRPQAEGRSLMAH